jgi:uncharacterized protein (DUF362 family)
VDSEVVFHQMRTVGLASAVPAAYPRQSPFHPEIAYPEFQFSHLSAEPNPAYAALRDVFRLLKLDSLRYGTKSWNPLRDFVRPGDRVVLKPNWVVDASATGCPIEVLVTHGSLIRAVLDYVLIGLQGSGSVVLYDTPIMDANFEEILKQSGVASVLDFLSTAQRVQVTAIDGRRRVVVGGTRGETIADQRRFGDPEGYTEFDLRGRSLHLALGEDWRRFDVGKGETGTMRMAHNIRCHKYLVSKSVLNADVIINLPKIKTHIKAGVTGALKNMVGIVGDKSYLPHYRRGGSQRGGDEYEGFDLFMEIRDRVADALRPKGKVPWQLGRGGWAVLRRIATLGRENRGITRYDVKSGSWPGNDTLWRTILDVNRILFYGDSCGLLHGEPHRRYVAIADGIVCGQGAGPLTPDPVSLGVVLCSANPAALDATVLKLMGYRRAAVRTVAKAFELVGDFPLASFDADLTDVVGEVPSCGRRFKEPPGWEGYLAPREGVTGV